MSAGIRTAAQPFDQGSFDAWLADDAPPRPQPRSASLRMGGFAVPVVANSALAGNNAQWALAADDAYARAAEGERVARLAQSPTTGAAMLLNLAMTQSQYDPSTPAAAGSAAAFSRYVAKILECPLFSALLDDHVTPGFGGGWNDVIERIVGYYEGIAPEDIATLRGSLQTIAAAASSNPSTNETTNLFSQATLKVTDTVDVYLYHTFVQMVSTVQHGGKHEPDTVSNQAGLDLYRVHLRFDSARWASQAEKVHQMTQQSLRDWLAGSSTPAGGLAANWSPGRW